MRFEFDEARLGRILALRGTVFGDSPVEQVLEEYALDEWSALVVFAEYLGGHTVWIALRPEQQHRAGIMSLKLQRLNRSVSTNRNRVSIQQHSRLAFSQEEELAILRIIDDVMV